MRAEHPPQLLVTALVDQVDVDLAERREVAVGVVDQVRLAARIDHLEPVVGDVGDVEDTAPDPAVLVLEARPPAVVDGGDRVRERPQHPQRHGAVVHVRAEDRVRVPVLTAHELLEDVPVDGEGGGGGHRSLASCWSWSGWLPLVSRAMPPSGMPIQPGRLRAS